MGRGCAHRDLTRSTIPELIRRQQPFDIDHQTLAADYNTIREISPPGTVRTIAGLPDANGSADGSGSEARFYGLSAIALDSAGNLYAADTENNTVRKGRPPDLVRPAPFNLQAQQLAGGGFRLAFRRGDGTLPSDLSRITVQWRTDLTSGTEGGWQTVNSGLIISGGFVIYDDPASIGQPHRFYRVVEP